MSHVKEPARRPPLVGHIALRVNTLCWELTETILAERYKPSWTSWNLRKSNLETLLDALKNLLVILAAHETDRETLGTETAGTTYTMEVRVGVSWQVVVDGQVDTLDIDSTTEYVGCDTDTLVELLELLVALDTLFLADTGVHRDRWEVALAEELVQLGGAHCRLDEDDDLVELEVVQELVELTVLLALAELDVVLLETVEGELGLVVDVNLKRVLHELLANSARVLGECGTEHHNLLLSWCGTEDLLDVAAHVCRVSVMVFVTTNF